MWRRIRDEFMLNYLLGKDIAGYVREHKKLVILALILTAVSAVFAVVPAYILQPFIDEGMTGTDPASWKIPWFTISNNNGSSIERTELVIIENVSQTRLLVILILVAFISNLFRSISSYFSQLAAAAFSNRAIRSIRIVLFEKFIALPLGFYHKQKAGELISRCTADLTVMQERIANILIGIVQHPLTALIFLVYLFIMNYKLTLLLFVAVPIIVSMVRLFGRKVKKHSTRVQDSMSYVTSTYQEALLCLKVIQGFCMGERESEKFAGLADQLYKKIMKWNRWFLGLGPMMDSTVFLVLPLVFLVGKIYFDQTLGELIAMSYAFSRVYSPLKSLARVNNEIKTLQGATERVFGIMTTEPAIQDNVNAIELPRHDKEICFHDAGFFYKPGQPVLENISLSIEKGEMVAFVGSTGAGKSTLLELIPRFYDLTSGSITIDGINVQDVTLQSLRRQIGIVSQEVLLFHDTITNNIRYGRPSIGMDEVVAAAKAANAHGFIKAQPSGYDSIVGDRGTLLSGGQRQRIAIARAILTEPSILVLDEAASALDAESERVVQEAIEEFMGKCTIIVVAHRLSTVRKADRIYVLERGKILESGSQDELIAVDGRFKQLHDIQFRD